MEDIHIELYFLYGLAPKAAKMAAAKTASTSTIATAVAAKTATISAKAI
jgi:hypothetical protein